MLTSGELDAVADREGAIADELAVRGSAAFAPPGDRTAKAVLGESASRNKPELGLTGSNTAPNP